MSCSSSGCQREHWIQGHRLECQAALSPAPSDVPPSQPSSEGSRVAAAGEQAPMLVPRAPPQPPIEVGQPQLVQLPDGHSGEQELAPLASHVIFPYDGYLQLAASPNSRLPLGMMNCGNRCSSTDNAIVCDTNAVHIHDHAFTRHTCTACSQMSFQISSCCSFALEFVFMKLSSRCLCL